MISPPVATTPVTSPRQGGEGVLPGGSTCKVLDWPELLSQRRQWRLERRTVVWTNGCFDLLHIGHVRNLEQARRFGDVLVVGVNSDSSVRQLKGAGRPIIPAEQRAALVAALECVSWVTIFDDLTPLGPISRLQPDVHCKGTDYKPPAGKPIPEAPIVESYGGRIEFLPLVPGISTTDVIHRICGDRNP